jgi:N-acetyl-D-muramate 6-phosphate phosphatase
VKNISAVLFDLDGTLLDTAGDLAQALNQLLLARNIKPLPLTLVRPVAGYGCLGLLKLGLNIGKDHPEYSALCEELLDHYFTYACDTTRFFPGMENVLAHLETNKLPWGIVTNKPQRFTTPLMKHLGLENRAACIISGDTLKKSKPDPDQILHACDLLAFDPATCIYIGDSRVDVEASRAAGIPVLAALYGYIPPGEDPQSWQADGYINHPEEILGWVAGT